MLLLMPMPLSLLASLWAINATLMVPSSYLVQLLTLILLSLCSISSESHRRARCIAAARDNSHLNKWSRGNARASEKFFLLFLVPESPHTVYHCSTVEPTREISSLDIQSVSQSVSSSSSSSYSVFAPNLTQANSEANELSVSVSVFLSRAARRLAKVSSPVSCARGSREEAKKSAFSAVSSN